MAGKRSAGLLLFRGGGDGFEVMLAHMGGPLWARRDAGAWSVPKGEYVPPEEARDAARREFEEELGLPPPDGRYVPLGESRQSGGKVVTVWAVEGDLDPDRIVPGTFEMEWPRGSGVTRAFPEIDRVAWFAPEAAGTRIVTGQRVFLERLAAHLRSETPE
ncbi:NUDIX domain-containing protein [Streptomyces halobius]|uniref:NUDIX domain-containing protein n=1 Tax=Streptomyces halobius TaxID=2879846 RepID=A0ABY4MK11_9ACTN|nr:NUDIX domain-containing protein [Streptomyces halobius]UQA96745.1 NUDIX domain-containing protein [Streptomyces halobius]